jgi:mycoredoxin
MNPDPYELRAAAATLRLASRTFAAEADLTFYHALLCLCGAPTLSTQGLSPLDTMERAMPVQEALTCLAVEYCRLFIGPRPVCPPYASAYSATVLGVGTLEAVQAFLRQHDMLPVLPVGAPIDGDDHAAVVLAILEQLHLAAAADIDAGGTGSDALAALATLRTTYADRWLPAFLTSVATESKTGPYAPVARLAHMAIYQRNLTTPPQSPRSPEASLLTIYSTPTCGFCHRLKTQLDRENIPYTDINIEEDPAAASYVESVNGGNQVVPTVVCGNGTVMTNPTLAEVKDCLQAVTA